MAKENTSTDMDLGNEADVRQLRKVVLIGLASFGEIERLSNQQEIMTACNRSIPDQMRVIHPTGCAETVSDFANALRLLDLMEDAALAKNAAEARKAA